MKIEIEGELPSLNEIIDAAKSHWSSYREMKETNTSIVAWTAKRLPCIERTKKIDVTIIWYCKDKRRDKDNIMAGQKFIFDGLKEAGIIENDGWKQIGDVTHRFRVDRKNPRIEIEIEEVLT
ncbi:RusA family crossover junction endodeoxyribonuclease [Paenibacillus alvei]|uniref:RusA family crossover junction endodeoxyribonuclease n=2 Tax=Paenibacillus alvei TaxID=44250 RepID=A0ABT4H1H3_PAEAL|nr:RusA family crossover junction endodeoxyribonuclease [Paenibacillus alvei]EJW14256.1 holliday junction resolvase [Paenibacillus alvei DSM 29]MCY9762628.1 RusA family crossover junction endodeoxyribonuclease [Paenibacillus alvei]MCY9769641.1 RusA family crossover junction endodeoxyribonuclease [Paenibacillus alvei]NEZ45527.1 RusA family crossover junction endodeoxyribonuclease [Paenibacillus alvei]